MPLTPLPIDDVLPELLAALSRSRCVVLRAPTGAGKTTRVPPALLDAGIAGGRAVVMLEPRRLAARAAARRMAHERGSALGDEVGYHVRFDRRAGKHTRILVVTEGLLLRMLQSDPFLESFGAVVFDEFHERNLDTDLALALVRRVQLDVRPDLAIVVMSATIAARDVAGFLGDAPVVHSEGRRFPVEIAHVDADERRSIPWNAARGIERALAATRGDVLAFLPGVGEIRRTRDELADVARRSNLALLELYGDLPPERQDEALRRADRRRVVLATNVAETSVTVEDVDAVVDTGYVRRLQYDTGVGLDRRVLGRVSRSSADQRAGRAGRTKPGVCIRLWSEREQRSLAEHEEPEIRRVDLAGAVLQLMRFGERDLERFPWFEAPPPAAVERARDLLRDLGAIDARNGVTELGRTVAALPAHPRVARLLVEAHRLGCVREGALAAALIAERDPFQGRPVAHASDSDVWERVLAVERTSDGRARAVLHAADAFERSIEGELGRAGSAESIEGSLLRSVLAAYPDRVARRRDVQSRRGVMVGGRGVRLADESSVHDAELFVCVDVDLGTRGERAEALVRVASKIEADWLPPAALSTAIEVEFDPQTKRVSASRRTRYRDLVLEEAQCGLPDDERVAEALAAAALKDSERLFEQAVDATFAGRVALLRRAMPELDLPALDVEFLRAHLIEMCAGKRSLDELARVDLAELYTARLGHRERRALEHEAPAKIQVPSGSWIRLEYPLDRPPVLSVRIQEVFGLADSPRVAAGRVQVLLHLLAPNGRPQQVTDDLRSFWSGAYQEMRKQMRARYPKHAWPEDPWNAEPERRPRRSR